MRTSKPSSKRVNKAIGFFALSITLALLITVIAGSISFTQGPSITPVTPYTDDNLTCRWTPSADAVETNVSWYMNGALFSQEPTTENQSAINPASTTKNDEWICNVTINNGTDIISSTATATIINSAPEEPNVFNSSGQDIGALEIIYEDQTYNYNINSSDNDGDTLTYWVIPVSSFCSVIDEDTGETVCSPTASNLGGNNTVGQKNITFWAGDNDATYPKSTGHTVLFNITPVNDHPQFSTALTNKNVSEGHAFNYLITGTDEENNIPLNFTISVNPALEIIVNIASNTSAIIMFEDNRSASYYEAGNYTITVTIADNQSANVTGSFNLTVIQVNVAPVLESIGTQNSTQGLPLLFYAYANDEDINNTLNFTIVPTECSIENPWNISTTNNSHNATALINITSLTNDHVICREVRITVIDDNGAEDFQDVFLNISNTNDPPNVGVLSSNFYNTGGDNITDLIAYAESQFIYLVNATDIDRNTYEGEVLTYYDNSSFFDINSSTGVIRFTPNETSVGENIITINATDDQGLSDSQEMNLEIISNSAPELMSIGNLSCAEDSLCFFIINATDANDDDLNFTSNNTGVFGLVNNASESPIIRAHVNYTPLQEDVGVYSVIVTARDIRGAANTETIVFTVNNTNDDPVLESFTFTIPIVETHGINFYIFADDEDYNLSSSYEYLNFSDANLTGKDLFDVSTLFNSSSNKTYGQIIFTPGIGDAGNYSVNVSVRDYYGANDWVVKNFTVDAKTNSPSITQITPYGRPYSNTTYFNFTSTSHYATNLTSINFSENRSVVYNVTVTDDTTSQEDLHYTWYINGSVNSTAQYINITYSLFSSRKYNVTLVVTDYTFENSSWTWNVTTNDVNRAPSLINSLINITVNSTTVHTDYLKKTNVVHFLDPDDDLNSNNDFEANETSGLTYDVTNCSVASISILNHSIRIVPDEVGSCNVYFTAEDYAGLNATSNIVHINVSSVPNSTEIIERPTSSSGGGGSSKTIAIPITKQEERPKAIELVVPDLVTIYKNETVLIPVNLQNNWNSTLLGIRINASTNDSSVRLEFTQDYFESLEVGERKNTTLMIKHYRLGENYEVKIVANVTKPTASDSALVMLNSIEQAETGEQIETKVTFAQDLLSDNPECAELNELLFETKKKLEEGSSEEASQMVDGVINGCKYLVSVAKKTEQKPQSIITKALEDKNLKNLLILAGVLILVTVGLLFIKKQRSESKEAKHEGKKGKKGKTGEKEGKEGANTEEIKPYWP